MLIQATAQQNVEIDGQKIRSIVQLQVEAEFGDRPFGELLEKTKKLGKLATKLAHAMHVHEDEEPWVQPETD